MRALVLVAIGAAILALVGVIAYLAGTEAAAAAVGGTGGVLAAAHKTTKFKQRRLARRKEAERREIAEHAQEAYALRAKPPSLKQAEALLEEIERL